MRMYYYRGQRPNFGDELNTWMWPRLLPDFFDEDDSTLFLGIGSTLYDFLPCDSKKVVFGAGYAGYTPPPVIDERWKFYFVRGRVTAEKLGLDAKMAVGDAAILVRSCPVVRPPKQHAVSFMPHWESARDGEWAEITREAGLHYIDPCADVDRVIVDVLASELVVTEAMHGAIVADALRVPWIPVRPLQASHRLKWLDWASALDLDLTVGNLSPSNALEFALSLIGHRRRYAVRLRRRGQGLRRLASGTFKDRAVRSLVHLSQGAVHLSRDSAIERAHARMLEQLQQLRRDFA